MGNRGEGLCEFCGKPAEFTQSTSFFCNYCLGCLKLVEEETKEAICKIKVEKKGKKK